MIKKQRKRHVPDETEDNINERSFLGHQRTFSQWTIILYTKRTKGDTIYMTAVDWAACTADKWLISTQPTITENTVETRFRNSKALSCKFGQDILYHLCVDDPSDEQQEDFMHEIEQMKLLGAHQNIVSLVGCCTLQEHKFLVIEYVPFGDLLQWLRRRRRSVRCSPKDI